MISSSNIIATGTLSASNIVSSSNITASNFVAIGSLYASNIVSSSNITGSNIVANVVNSSNIIATGILSGSNIVANVVNSSNIIATGIVSGSNIVANIVNSSNIIATGIMSGSNIISSSNITASNVVATGTVSGNNIVSSSNMTASNVVANSVTANGSIACSNLTTSGGISLQQGLFILCNAGTGNIALSSNMVVSYSNTSATGYINVIASKSNDLLVIGVVSNVSTSNGTSNIIVQTHGVASVLASNVTAGSKLVSGSNGIAVAPTSADSAITPFAKALESASSTATIKCLLLV